MKRINITRDLRSRVSSFNHSFELSGVVLTKNDKNYLSPWLYCPQLNPRANVRLFCFHYAGGNAMVFRNWHERLPASVEVCAVQLPGRGRRLNENPFASVTSVVRPVSDALVPYCDKPFAFFGHSMGALLSFEIARQFRRKAGDNRNTCFSLAAARRIFRARRRRHMICPLKSFFSLCES